MSPAKNEPVRIDYPKQWFLLMAVVIEAIIIWLFYGTWFSPEGSWRTTWLIVTPTIGTVVFVFLVPPLFTHHLAGEKGLRLKMGLLLDSTVPYAWIKEIRETSVTRGGMRVGIGVRYFGISRVLFVTSSFSNLAKITLDREHTIGRVLRRPVSEIVLSVNYMPSLMENVRGRITSRGNE